MRYYQLHDPHPRLVVRDGDITADLTGAAADLRSVGDLARTAAIVGCGVDDVAEPLLDRAVRVDPDLLRTGAAVPVVADEVWAAGVTYEISEQAREAESGMPEIYLDVYEAERPEVFLKATPGRTVGPGEAVGIREDSTWNVPEPELGIVCYRGEIVGYTIGNDVSSRSIEGENPLYLPQAKVYDRCCSLGPCVTSAAAVDDPHDLAMSMRIERDGAPVYEDETSTGEMVRTCEELVSYVTRHNAVPDLTVVLTGTSLVPDDEFTLRAGDVVTIEIEGIGTLENDVVEV